MVNYIDTHINIKKEVVNTTPDVDVLYSMLLEAKNNGVEIYRFNELDKRANFKRRI